MTTRSSLVGISWSRMDFVRAGPACVSFFLRFPRIQVRNQVVSASGFGALPMARISSRLRGEGKSQRSLVSTYSHLLLVVMSGAVVS